MVYKDIQSILVLSRIKDDTGVYHTLKFLVEKGRGSKSFREISVIVRISGDGAKMTRQTSFVVLSFSIVDWDDVMSPRDNLTCC